MKVLRVYHSGRSAAHRERDRALLDAGAEVTLVVPTQWPHDPVELDDEPFPVVGLPVRRAGDVNRHVFAAPDAFGTLLARVRPDVLDLHEEPFSSVVHQVLGLVPDELPVVGYTAQNLDKRFPPPFAQWERAALRRMRGLYPCTDQAAGVAVGKGFTGDVAVLPLAPSSAITRGDQPAPGGELHLLLVGRLLPRKGVLDAVRVLAALGAGAGATLTLVGEGEDAEPAAQLAARLGVGGALTVLPWLAAEDLAAQYRRAHVLLAPSITIPTWVEQFGRMVVEARAAGAVVVGYASGSLPEVVGEAGLLVPEGDVAALSAAVDSLRDATRWQTLRSRGLAVSSSETWDAVARGHVALYERVCRPGGERWPARDNRIAARDRFGEPATGGSIERPFALPILRDHARLADAAAKVCDLRQRQRQPPGRLQVVYLDHVAALSGGEIALARLVEELTEVDAHVILGEDGPLRARLAAAGATVEVMALDPRVRDARRGTLLDRPALGSGLIVARYVLRLARRLRQLSPDVVHTNSLKAGYYGAIAARLAGRPVVWHLRDRVAPDYLPPRVVRTVRWALQHLPHVVVANSRETLRTAAVTPGRGSVLATTVVHSGYRAAAGAPAPEVEDDGPLVVGIVGRLAPWKGHDVLLRAVAEPTLSSVRLRVAGSALFGEDGHAAALAELAADLGIEDRVTFLGFVEDVAAELGKLDVLVHASTVPEPWGQAVLEGMAAGLPVIATGAGGPAEIITDGVDGLLVAPDDPAALADALLRVTDGATRRRLGAAARVRAGDFDPADAARSLVRTYRDLVAARRRR